MNDNIQGRRIYPPPYRDIIPSRDIKAGDYWFDKSMSQWFCCVPTGEIGNLLNHRIIEQEDGTITVSPSILTSGYDYDLDKMVTWHGYLVNGIWHEV